MRFSRNKLAVAFFDWLDVVDVRQRTEAESAAAAANTEKSRAAIVATETSRRNKSARFEKNWEARRLRICVSRWRSETLASARQTRLVQRALVRLTNRRVVGAVARWRAGTCCISLRLFANTRLTLCFTYRKRLLKKTGRETCCAKPRNGGRDDPWVWRSKPGELVPGT
jgi:hypothetical protein